MILIMNKRDKDKKVTQKFKKKFLNKTSDSEWIFMEGIRHNSHKSNNLNLWSKWETTLPTTYNSQINQPIRTMPTPTQKSSFKWCLSYFKGSSK